MRHQKRMAPISQKDRAFFDDLLKNYERFFKNYAMKYASADIPLEDIQQEAMLRLIFHRSDLENLTHNQTCAYIAEAVKHAFVDLYRKEKKYSHVSMDNVLEELMGMECDLVPDLFINQELRRLRKDLTAREWMALKGKYVFGYSQEELGQQLDIAPDSVRMFLCRVRRRAKEILSPEKVTGGGDK